MADNYNNLFKKVLSLSNATVWDLAVKEWEVYDCDEDEMVQTRCICGKEGLRYLFTIKNRENGNILKPIGSSCIKKFGEKELYEDASIWEQEFELYNAVKNNDFIDLKGGLFSRKLLAKFYEEGAFKPNEYNDYCEYNDYEFMVKMFNKRDLSDKQKSKCSAIILNSILPYVKRKLKK